MTTTSRGCKNNKDMNCGINKGDGEGLLLRPKGAVAGKAVPVGGDRSPLRASITAAAFVLTTLCVGLLAVRNTLTLHLQNFWGASGDFWQQLWDKAVLAAGGDMFVVMLAGMAGASYFVYWALASLFIFMDLTGQPRFLRRYKVQPGTNEPVDIGKLLKVVAVVNFNQVVLGPVVAYIAYQLFLWRGYDSSPSLPTFHWVLLELAIFVIMEEIGFYYTHRILHHRLLYKHFHKLHHEWQSPIAPVVLYCHPVEFFVSNMLPGLMGPVLTGSHMATFLLWIQIQIIFSMYQHSGYHFPFMPSPEAHDYHHLKFNQCYGVLGVLDLLHGTDDRFRASKCYDRDQLLLSLTPLRETYPDHPSDKTESDTPQ